MGVRSLYHQIMYLILLCLLKFGDSIRIRRICKDSIEILSNQGARIEPYHKSHVRLGLLDPAQLNPNIADNTDFQLTFEFRTTSSNGILFYGRSRSDRDLVALILQGGDLIYKIQCPSLHADILLPTFNNSRINDGHWHTINYTINHQTYDRNGKIEVDGNSISKRYAVSCQPLTTLVMGGFSDKHTGQIGNLESLAGHFEGCIKNVYLPVPLKHPPRYYAVSVCD